MKKLNLIFMAGLLVSPATVAAMPETDLLRDGNDSTRVYYDNGWRIDGGSADMTLNAQIRAGASYIDVDNGDNQNNFDVYSARLEAAGSAVNGDVSYQLEYDFADEGTLLDAWAQLNFSEQARLRIGQTKVPYSRQQLAEGNQLLTPHRSLVTNTFGLGSSDGRDRGIVLHGETGRAGYAIGAFNGEGSNNDAVDTDLGFGAHTFINFGNYGSRLEESDLRSGDRSLAFTLGGGARYQETDIDEVLGLNLDAGLRVEGTSANAEFHWADQEVSGIDNDSIGVLAQVGHNFGDFEIGLQFSHIEPDEGEDTQEYTLVGTRYLNGHNSKIQLGVTFNEFTDLTERADEGLSQDEDDTQGDIQIDLVFTQRL